MREASPVTELYGKDGRLYGVLLSPELWNEVSKVVLAMAKDIPAECACEPEPERPEPMEDWNMLKDYWDFRYDYEAKVQCDNCGNATDDWEKDDPRKFRLTAANLGGQVTFSCQNCGSRIIKRHFKDHIDYQCCPCND